MLLSLALGLIGAAVAVIEHRSARRQELLRTGVAVTGRVINRESTRRGEYWVAEVEWSFAGQRYFDRETLATRGEFDDIPPVGATVPVVFDRADPSWASINGVFTGSFRHRLSVGLLLFPGGVALLDAVWLGLSALKIRAVTVTLRGSWPRSPASATSYAEVAPTSTRKARSPATTLDCRSRCAGT